MSDTSNYETPSQAELDEFVRTVERRSFAIVPRIIDQDDILELKTALAEAIASDPFRTALGGRDAGMPHALVVRGRPFERLLTNRRLRGFLDSLLGPTCVLYAYTASSMAPAGKNYSVRVHVDCPRFIPGYITNVGVTLMLDDFTEQNGATFLWPGSHRIEGKPSDDEFFRTAVRGVGKAGDAILFNARCWHRGGENGTSEWRHSVTMNVCRGYMKQQMDWMRLVPTEVFDRNPPEFRQFLGGNVRVPTSLDEFYLPESDRLYKANQG